MIGQMIERFLVAYCVIVILLSYVDRVRKEEEMIWKRININQLQSQQRQEVR